jgi:hypothetical protein
MVTKYLKHMTPLLSSEISVGLKHALEEESEYADVTITAIVRVDS